MTLHHIMLVVLAVLVVLLVATIVQLWRWSRVVRGWEETWRDRAREDHRRAAELRSLVDWGHGSDAPDDCKTAWAEARRFLGRE